MSSSLRWGSKPLESLEPISTRGWTRGVLRRVELEGVSHRWSFKVRSPKTKERLKILKQSQIYLLCACLTNLTDLHVPTYIYDCMTIFMWSFVCSLGETAEMHPCFENWFCMILLFCSAIIIHKGFLKRSSWASEHVILGTQAGNIIEHDSVIYEADTATEDVWETRQHDINVLTRHTGTRQQLSSRMWSEATFFLTVCIMNLPDVMWYRNTEHDKYWPNRTDIERENKT
jgi:hypothetical protein